jgi:CheY-like chemotaxis protein
MKKHILLIDDDEDELTIFVDGLNQVNIPYKCTWARSGEQAIKQLTYLTPDIIFLDFNMPSMNGLDCLAAIKQLPGVQHIPVILHSFPVSAELREKGMQLGAAICLEKPETTIKLAGILNELIPFGEGTVAE